MELPCHHRIFYLQMSVENSADHFVWRIDIVLIVPLFSCVLEFWMICI
uniref:Uncharacterized protein n=1 Tax=Arundo donax TaxID=35708 RepID=A0A0A9GXV5_ARUDO